MMKPKQLSLCVVTRNDEDLSACLNDMKEIADEILVVAFDSGGQTLASSGESGATVYSLDWKEDFSQVLNFCMEHAQGEWVLFLQADEVIPPEQRKQIKSLLQNPNAEAYLFYVDYSPEERGFSSPVQFLRLIRKRKEYRFQYRSFAAVPEESLYAVQSVRIRISHRGGKRAGWQLHEQIRLLEKDVEENPQNSYLRYMEGIEYLNQGKMEQSIASFEMARQTAKCGYLYVPHLYKCLAYSLLALGKNDRAEEVLNEGVPVFYDYNDLLVLRAELFHRLGRTQEALEDLQMCLAIRKHQNTFVPVPEIDSSVITEMEEEIKSGAQKIP